jgi:transcriptional regulator with XRE-family HTH domain
MTDKQKIKIIRSLLDMSQAELATALGMQQGSLSDVERGKSGVSKALRNKLNRELYVDMGFWEEKWAHVFIPGKEDEAEMKASKFKSGDKGASARKSQRIVELENKVENLSREVAELNVELEHRDKLLEAKDDTVEVLKKYVNALEKDKVDLKIELEAIKEKFFTKTGARKSG